MGSGRVGMEACPVACLRLTMRFVPLESEKQPSVQPLHRDRLQLVGNSTQLINQARALVLERGIAMSQGKYKLSARLPEILEDADNGLPGQIRCMLAFPISFAACLWMSPCSPLRIRGRRLRQCIRPLRGTVLILGHDHRRRRGRRTPLREP